MNMTHAKSAKLH